MPLRVRSVAFSFFATPRGLARLTHGLRIVGYQLRLTAMKPSTAPGVSSTRRAAPRPRATDRPAAIQPRNKPMTGRVRIRREPRPAPLSCLQTCCRPRSSTPLLQRPEDSRALPSAGAGCPSAHTRLPSRLPLNPFQALARRVQPPVPLGHRGQRHADRVRRRAVAQTAAAPARARTPVSSRRGGYPA